jgi:hypothetical protein
MRYCSVFQAPVPALGYKIFWIYKGSEDLISSGNFTKIYEMENDYVKNSF